MRCQGSEACWASWHRAGKADKTHTASQQPHSQHERGGLQSALPVLGGACSEGGDGDLFRTPLSIASGVLPPGSAGPGSCERGRPAWQRVARNRWFGSLSVLVILRSTLAVIGRLGSQTPSQLRGREQKKWGAFCALGFVWGDGLGFGFL